MNPEAAFERVRMNLFQHRTVQLADRELVIACLLREADWRPLRAPWWKGKEACIIGADLDGNFLLRHCDGSVRLWIHRDGADRVIAPSVREFVVRIG